MNASYGHMVIWSGWVRFEMDFPHPPANFRQCLKFRHLFPFAFPIRSMAVQPLLASVSQSVSMNEKYLMALAKQQCVQAQ